jgi:hypothetical protein
MVTALNGAIVFALFDSRSGNQLKSCPFKTVPDHKILYITWWGGYLK